jgi:hypothetical protein
VFREFGAADVFRIENLTEKVVVWATEIAARAAQLPSSSAREAYLAERRQELIAGGVAEGVAEAEAAALADACVEAARQIMDALIARGLGNSQARH